MKKPEATLAATAAGSPSSRSDRRRRAVAAVVGAEGVEGTARPGAGVAPPRFPPSGGNAQTGGESSHRRAGGKSVGATHSTQDAARH